MVLILLGFKAVIHPGFNQVLLGLLLHNCLQLKVTFMSKWHVWGATVWCFFNTKGTNLEKAETAVAGSLG